MTFLPIVERELRTRAKRGSTYWTRMGVGIAGALFCLAQLSFAPGFGGSAAAGRTGFNSLVGIMFLFCCAACLMTSDSISSERREGTLGLLFLTRVKSFDVVLGKLGPAVLAGFCAVVAFLPMLMIPVLSGGVTGGEAFRKGLALLDTLFLALAAGFWASVRGTGAHRTGRAAVLLLAGVVLLPCAFAAEKVLGRALSLLSPLMALFLAGDWFYQKSPLRFWISLCAVQAVAWLLISVAATRLRQSLVELPEDLELESAPPAINASPAATSAERRAYSSELEPIGWLVASQRGVQPMIWTGAVIGAIHLLLFNSFFGMFGGTMLLRYAALPVHLVASVARGCLFAWAVTRFFVNARQTGEFELLSTTPQGARRLVVGQSGYLKRIFPGPVVLMFLPLLLQGLYWLLSVGNYWASGTSFWWIYWVNLITSAVNLGLGLIALCWVGIWFGLTARNQSAAVISTVWWVTVLPALLSLGFSLAGSAIARIGILPYPIIAPLPYVMLTAYYLLLIARTRELLNQDLRNALYQQLSFGGGSVDWMRNLWASFRKVRHWTPS